MSEEATSTEKEEVSTPEDLEEIKTKIKNNHEILVSKKTTYKKRSFALTRINSLLDDYSRINEKLFGKKDLLSEKKKYLDLVTNTD